MPKDFMTGEQVELEIARLSESEAVALARQEQRYKYRRRQYLYTLRWLEKHGKELMAMGKTESDFVCSENDEKEEESLCREFGS